MLRDCNECETEYRAEPRYLNRGQGLFCSRRCSSLYHGRLRAVKHEPNTMCSWCGIDFYRKESRKKSKSETYYCSVEHQNLGAENGIHLTGPADSIAREPNKCSYCTLPMSKNGRPGASIHTDCKRKNIIDAWLSGNNSITLSRSRSDGHPVDTKGFVKRYLLDIRGDQCEVCGWNEKAPDGRSIIQMDHINGNCFDNRPENLQLLCPNHHAMTPTYGILNRGSGRAHRRR